MSWDPQNQYWLQPLWAPVRILLEPGFTWACSDVQTPEKGSSQCLVYLFCLVPHFSRSSTYIFDAVFLCFTANLAYSFFLSMDPISIICVIFRIFLILSYLVYLRVSADRALCMIQLWSHPPCGVFVVLFFVRLLSFCSVVGRYPLCEEAMKITQSV